MKISDFAEYVSGCVKNHDRLEQENAELRSVLTKVLGQAGHRAATRHIFEHDEFQWALDFLNKRRYRDDS